MLAIAFAFVCTARLRGVEMAPTHLTAPNKHPGTAATETCAAATNARKKVALDNMMYIVCKIRR